MTTIDDDQAAALPAAASGTFRIGGDLAVHRLGYGTMQLPGPGVWGPSRDRDGALRVLRRAVDLGVTFFDTADSYGPGVAEELVHDALHPYDGIVVATKVGFTRPGPGRWANDGRPSYLRSAVEASLRRLQVERIDLLQLHRIDPRVALADQIGTLADLRQEGKIRHLGLSEVSVQELDAAAAITPIATVQNLYNLAERSSQQLLHVAEQRGIGFIPWFPLATGQLSDPRGPLARLAVSLGLAPSQVALAWLLNSSPVVLPIPGTSSLTHLEENVAAAGIELDPAVLAQLNRLA
ncbi:aryl-alcohol dehydrogenase-like predicted oxidoreductase [Kineococcus radiotolerans]|uniref:Aryl-alcohol dehydrogenase-like predicted oxidoreductase n=1 Tax=Kineococcus radiotolerans TaxID=131568 RepID=A0A7W4TRX5_KINRA|nr:aldo/keto reductase [Kineococcus radiotolerans]MBB2903613.1 aryl-alcohol dehydrogenase-like predicted oxidoreductase [Kineococcus radiotolerans]